MSFESYEKMFDNLIKEEEIDFEAQPLTLHVKAMESSALISSLLKKVRKYAWSFSISESKYKNQKLKLSFGPNLSLLSKTGVK